MYIEKHGEQFKKLKKDQRGFNVRFVAKMN